MQRACWVPECPFRGVPECLFRGVPRTAHALIQALEQLEILNIFSPLSMPLEILEISIHEYL